MRNALVVGIVVSTLMAVTPAVAADPIVWASCWHNQELVEHQCRGTMQPISAYDARKLLQVNTHLRLPTPAELRQFLVSEQATALRQQAADYGATDVLTSEFMAHGNEFLATTVNINSAKVELQPWHQPVLVVWIKKP